MWLHIFKQPPQGPLSLSSPSADRVRVNSRCPRCLVGGGVTGALLRKHRQPATEWRGKFRPPDKQRALRADLGRETFPPPAGGFPLSTAFAARQNRRSGFRCTGRIAVLGRQACPFHNQVLIAHMASTTAHWRAPCAAQQEIRSPKATRVLESGRHGERHES